MTAFAPGQPVTVHIGGHDIDAEVRWSDDVNETVGVGYDARTFTVPADWVEPVTPPCPWTANGTVISYDSDKGHYDTVARLQGDTWYRLHDHTALDWATDIAPYNPRRLVAEQPSTPLLMDQNGDLWRLSETTEHWAGPDGKRVTRSQLEGTWGPLTEVPSS